MRLPQTNTGPEKKAYTKPVLKQVDLRPDEAVLGNCKTGSPGSGPASSNCNMPAACNVIGT